MYHTLAYITKTCVYLKHQYASYKSQKLCVFNNLHVSQKNWLGCLWVDFGPEAESVRNLIEQRLCNGCGIRGGARSSRNRYNSAERFDPQLGQWHALPPMAIARRARGARLHGCFHRSVAALPEEILETQMSK